MQYLLTDSSEELKLKKINDTLISLFYVSTGFPQLNKIFFFIKNTKSPIFQQFIIGNTQVVVLKRMLEHFLKIPPLYKTIKNY